MNTKRPRDVRTSIPADWVWDMSRMGYWRLSYQPNLPIQQPPKGAPPQHTGGLGSIEPCASSSRSPTHASRPRGERAFHLKKREEKLILASLGEAQTNQRAAAVREAAKTQKSRTRGPPVSTHAATPQQNHVSTYPAQQPRCASWWSAAEATTSPTHIATTKAVLVRRTAFIVHVADPALAWLPLKVCAHLYADHKYEGTSVARPSHTGTPERGRGS